MRSAHERQQINQFLGRAGLAQLDEAGPLVQQLAFMVRDEAHFRSLLTRCDPEQRRGMYEAMVPHLRFTAKPLDVYVAEAARDAEIRQLPTVDAAGQLQPFRAAEVRSDEFVIQQAIAKSLAKHHLIIKCVKCTREADFYGERKIDAIAAARNEGWTYDELNGTGREICPQCPGGRAKRISPLN
jgi:hypothetical protein